MYDLYSDIIDKSCIKCNKNFIILYIGCIALLLVNRLVVKKVHCAKRNNYKMQKLFNLLSCKSLMNKYTNILSKPVMVRKYCSSIKSVFLEIKLKESFSKFPIVWLRDNCQCDECFHPNSKSRIINWINFDVNILPENVEEGENNLIIKWKDGHSSTFNKDWLSQRTFTKESQDVYLKKHYRKKQHMWNKNNFNNILTKYTYESIIDKDECLKKWLETLSKFGVAVITNVPDDEEAGTNIANRVEFTRETHYGKKFSVKAKPGTTNVAYLSTNLQMHTDLPYYEYKPGVNLLHFITQTRGEGGESVLSDGLYVANILKQNHPDLYKVLSNTLVDWEDIGREGNNAFHSIYRSPVICENLEGEITRINHSVPQRGSHFNVSIDTVKPWYNAMKLFVKLIHEHAVTLKMVDGEMLCFDNKRLLHGRNEYHDTDDRIRNVVGVYLDWDYIYSRLRVLS